jgi:prepilin-type N-terminal cleavage/methylation domain-containing protein
MKRLGKGAHDPMNATRSRGQLLRSSGRLLGFTLIELLLVTVIVGIIATIAAPYLQRDREEAILTLMQEDVRNLMEGVDAFVSLNQGRWPRSLQEVEAGGRYVPNEGVEYCVFRYVPARGERGPYAIALVGHRGTRVKVFTAHPLWEGRTIEYDSENRGC